MHAVGQGAPADLDTAEAWWLRAAAGGNAEAMGDLGQLYAYHRQDPVRAVYRAGSLAGQPLAAVNLWEARQTRQAR